MKPYLFLLLLIVLSLASYGQDSTGISRLLSSPDKLFRALEEKSASIEGKLDRQTVHYLSKLQRQERKLQKKLWKKDSTLAKQLFEGVEDKYSQLQKAPESIRKYSSVYSGHLDSLTTSLHFLKDKNLISSPELQNTLAKYASLQGKLNQADQIKNFLGERQKLLKQQLEGFGLVKQLRGFQKQAYYYQAQVREYKELWEDPSKAEQKLMEVVMKVPQFKEFFAKNSMLGSLFALPGGGNMSPTASVIGLQTRAAIDQSIVSRLGSSFNVAKQLDQNVQSGQGQLNALKSKLSSFSTGSYSNGDADFPNNSKVNSQKTKTFFQRIELGTNIQVQPARYMFPVMSDIGLSINYKLNDQAFAGVGLSGSIGLGASWDNLKLSYQGLGVRSNFDWKLKDRFYISSGYEMNYKNLIHTLDQLKNYPAWQVSGLVGLSNKYQISKKLKGEIKLLWDFMSYRQAPRGQPILFRVGYSLK